MKRSMYFLISVLCLAILGLGCATAYQTEGWTGGYSDLMMNENMFQVSFRGNGYTSFERASDFSLLRCAEIALSHGFNYFVIVDANQYITTSTYTTPTSSRTTGSATIYGNTVYGNSRTTTYGGQTYKISKPSLKNTILCFPEKPEIEALIYDARIVSRSLKAKWGRAIKGR